MQERFSALPLTQKLLLVGIPAVVFSLIVTALIYSLQPDYAVLYANMSPEDMNAVLTELDKEGIRYRVGRDGRSVLVPEDKVRDIRLKLAAKGIPNKGVIGKEPSASVFVKLRPGADMNPEQVRAIRNLVAASVEGLKPERVVVIDDRGRNLTAALDENEEEVSAKQLSIKKQVKKDIERKVQTALDFSKVKRREELYDPDMTAVVSEQKKKEKTTGFPVGGVPGAAANIPSGQGAVSGQGTTP